MASERGSKGGVIIGAGFIAGAAFLAGGFSGSPRLMVLCALAAIPAAGLLFSSLRRLTVPPVRKEAPSEITLEQQALIHNALALETQLEHAPIALFQVAHASGLGAVVALNANARRLMAPGRASDPAALHALLQQQPADSRNLIAFDTERGEERALVSVCALTVGGTAQRLAALMPAESELEAEALKAWRQLVHVLTHEIMNSLTPVASLSRTAFELLGESRAVLPADVGDDLATALDAIGRRAASLVEFVGSYRSLSNLPQAQAELVRLDALFARVAALVAPHWQERGGSALFTTEPASLELMADPGQLEQALINLLKNAAEATVQVAQPKVTVAARLARGGRLRIDVTDNGPGVPAHMAAHIFTPFVSTKRQGGGIGLAMVRQLVHGNGGTVRYAKLVGAGAQFVITF
jgi:C4-dicarboxylate-specific signal transduction histidine kinase